MRNEENKTFSAVKRGFTLVELLVVVAIIGVLGTIAIQNVTEYLHQADLTAAQTQVQSLHDATVTYYMKYKKQPDDIRDLINEDDEGNAIMRGGENAIIDPWGNEFILEKKGRKCIVKSAGPDGDISTEDDLSSDKIKKDLK